jgi:hypothetical protein
MKSLGRIILLTLILALGIQMGASPAQAAVSCHTINAKGIGRGVDDHDNNPATVATIATIQGGGLLHGTTSASFEITGMAGTIASFDGTLTFTTNKATLTVAIVGSLDVVSGAFSATGDVVAATDKLAGATGTLHFEGVQDLTTGDFTEDVTGNICVDLGS